MLFRSKEVLRLENEVEKLSLDLGIKNQEVGPGWDKVAT